MGAQGGVLGKLAAKGFKLSDREKKLQQLTQPIFSKACMDLAMLDSKKVFYGPYLLQWCVRATANQGQ